MGGAGSQIGPRPKSLKGDTREALESLPNSGIAKDKYMKIRQGIDPPSSLMSDGTAKKRDPQEVGWGKSRACKKMGGHSARAMQLAVKYYKDAGGTYEGKKSKDNKLSKWSKEDWQTKEEYEKKEKK